ncbi:MAG: GHKL domain-containing protein [Pyrinomonadaceae bacterium]|nr:GHKL domain-containing protein [Phycisphaerales bacterium]
MGSAAVRTRSHASAESPVTETFGETFGESFGACQRNCFGAGVDGGNPQACRLTPNDWKITRCWERMSHQVLRTLSRLIQTPVQAFLAIGIASNLDDPLKKRIRLTNAVALFGAFVMLGSIPFDYIQAPSWMVAEDVVGGLAYLILLVLNRHGWLLLSRVICLALSNFIVLGNAALLGRDSGAQMVFIALCALPFTLFDVHDRKALTFGVMLSIGCFALAQSGVLNHLRDVPDNFSADTFTVYSATITFLGLLFCLGQVSVANARAEQALRQDIQERLRTERELEVTRQSSIHSAKMAALGEMSGNIAHEVNNPLTAIVLRAQLLRRLVTLNQADAAVVEKAAAHIETTADRIRRIVDALRTFARDAEGEPLRAEPVSQIVQNTIDLCAQRFQDHAIDILIDPIADDLAVECRGIQISQILLNLLSNAHDAVVDQASRWVRIAVIAQDAHVQIVVTDSGPGIPAGLETRIMTPFFTTKDVGKGTGLGLSVSKAIAEAHNGHLVYDPSSPVTRFVLTLVRARTL